MEVFSAPASTFRSSENQENTIRKNGPAKALQRKPFLDKPVNSNTPGTDRSAKAAHPLKFQSTNTQEKQSILDDLAHDFMFSYKMKDDDEYDTWPKPNLLGSTEGIINLVRNYCNGNYITPPLSPISNQPEAVPVFLDFPKMKSYEENEDVFFESVSEVDIPPFDCSY